MRKPPGTATGSWRSQRFTAQPFTEARCGSKTPPTAPSRVAEPNGAALHRRSIQGCPSSGRQAGLAAASDLPGSSQRSRALPFIGFIVVASRRSALANALVSELPSQRPTALPFIEASPGRAARRSGRCGRSAQRRCPSSRPGGCRGRRGQPGQSQRSMALPFIEACDRDGAGRCRRGRSAQRALPFIEARQARVPCRGSP